MQDTKRRKSTLEIYGGIGDKITMLIIYTFLTLFVVLIILPCLNVISSSMSSPSAVQAGQVLLRPIGLNFGSYIGVLQNKMIKTGFINSVINTLIGTVYNVVFTVLAAYPLSRKDMFGHGFFTFLFTLTMFIGGGMIPSYLVVNSLGMVNTRWALIIPGAFGVWNVIVTRTFFNVNVPKELLEAAKIDGCDDFNFFFRIVLPVSTAVLAVQFMMYAVGHWNSYFGAVIYINKPELKPLQMVLRDILVLNSMDGTMTADKMQAYMAAEEARMSSYTLKYAVIIIASIPMMAMYPFIQKHFVKGMLIGSIKG